MGDYACAAEFYDLLYAEEKDYAADVDLLVSMVRDANEDATSILDVGCGTGAHARGFFDMGFDVAGVDLEPAFVDIARARCPKGTFVVGDMRTFSLGRQFDAVTCLFSAIGYVLTDDGLRAAIRRMSEHLNPGGVLLVDPWFEPGQLTPGWISTLVGRSDDVTVCRMSRTLIDGPISRLEFEYLIGTSAGIERRSEVHELGLFTQEQMEAAFRAAGLNVDRKEKALRTRGVYIGQVPLDAS